MRDERKVKLLLFGIVAIAVTALIATPLSVANAAFTSVSSSTDSSWSSSASFGCRKKTTVVPATFGWNFSESAGNLVSDDSGNGNTATLNDTATRVLGDCAQDGGPFISLASPSQPGAVSSKPFSRPAVFSIQIWFRTTTTTGGRLINFGSASSGESSYQDRMLWMDDDGRLYFGVFPDTVKVVSSTSRLNDGSWHHAVASLSPSGQILYVDGVRVAYDPNTRAKESRDLGYWRVGYDRTLGWTPVPSSPGFTGDIDGVALFPDALTPAQVEAQHMLGH